MEDPSVNPAASAKKDFDRLGMALFAIAAATILLQLLFGRLAASGRIQTENSWLVWVLTFAPLYLVGIPIGLLIMRSVPAEHGAGEPLRFGQFLIFLLMCFPLMYAGNLVGTMLSMVLSGGTAENPLNGLVFDTSPLKILVIVVLAPLAEEYVFRKQLIDRTARYGEKTAILFSALSFGLFHMNLFQFFYAFALGLLFAYVYLRTRRLRYSLAMHMIVNFLGSVLAPFILSLLDGDMLDQLMAGQVDPEAVLDYLPQLLALMAYSSALMGLSVAGLVMLIVRRRRFVFRPAEQELPADQVFTGAFLRPGYVFFTLLCAVICVFSLIGSV